MRSERAEILRFGVFEVDVRAGEVRKHRSTDILRSLRPAPVGLLKREQFMLLLLQLLDYRVISVQRKAFLARALEIPGLSQSPGR